MEYPYILCKETEEGLIPQVQFNLTLASIQGIYAAQICSVVNIDLRNTNPGFQLLSKNPVTNIPWNELTLEDAYLTPLNNLLDYLLIAKKQNYDEESYPTGFNAARFFVDFDRESNIEYLEEKSLFFTHTIRYYNSRRLSERGIGIVALNFPEFISGFLKYFELLYQNSNHNIKAYGFEIQEYQKDLSQNTKYGYVKVGNPIFRSSIHEWLFSALPRDIKNEIAQYIPKTFCAVDKYYQVFTHQYLIKYCKRRPKMVLNEIYRRILDRYSVDRILEICDSKTIILHGPSEISLIIRTCFDANYPEIFQAIIAMSDLRRQVAVRNQGHRSVGDLITRYLRDMGKKDISNAILVTLASHKDYLPARDEIQKLYPIIGKDTMLLLLINNKIDINTISHFAIREMSEGGIEALIEFEAYRPDTNNYLLPAAIIERLIRGTSSLSILEKLLDRVDFDPSYQNNALLEIVLEDSGDNSSIIEIILNNSKTNIYLDNNRLLPRLAALYPTQLLTRLQKDGLINNIELMNQYVYPYLPKK
jgi:hypothetical protein